MQRLSLLLTLCALFCACCLSSCGSNGAGDELGGVGESLTAELSGAALAGGGTADADEIVGKSASKAGKWSCVPKCWCYKPGAVKDLKATSDAECVTLSWKKVVKAHGYRINYRVVGAPKWTLAGTSNTNSFKFCDVAGCTKYEFRVRALNCCGMGPWCETVTSWIGGEPATAPPGAVSGLTLTAGATSIKATWEATSGAEGYTVEYRAEGATDWTEAGVSTLTEFELTDGLLPCTFYEVRVRASNCKGDGEWSAPVQGWIGDEPATAMPGTVANLTLTAGATSITADWDDLEGADSYSVQFRAAGATDWTDAGLATDSTLELTEGLVACTRYEVRVRATNCRGDGEWGAAATGWIGSEPPGSAPGAVTLTGVSTGAATITVNWNALDGAESYEVSYRAQGATEWTVAGISTTTSFEQTTGLEGCTYYEFRVRASNCLGDGAYSENGTGYIGESPEDCGEDECQPCKGKVSQLTLRFDGKQAADVTVLNKAGDELFSGNVAAGGEFTLESTDALPFGNKIVVSWGDKSVPISTNCKEAIGPGSTFGKFTIVSGVSSKGGELCPATPCPVCEKHDCKHHKKACKCKAGGKGDCGQHYDKCKQEKKK